MKEREKERGKQRRAERKRSLRYRHLKKGRWEGGVKGSSIFFSPNEETFSSLFFFEKRKPRFIYFFKHETLSLSSFERRRDYAWRQTEHHEAAAAGDGGDNGSVAVCELVNECRRRRGFLLFSCCCSSFRPQALRLGPPVPLLLQAQADEDELKRRWRRRFWPVSENAARRGEEQVRERNRVQPMRGRKKRSKPLSVTPLLRAQGGTLFRIFCTGLNGLFRIHLKTTKKRGETCLLDAEAGEPMAGEEPRV